MNSYSTDSDQWEGTELERIPLLSRRHDPHLHLLMPKEILPRKSWKQIFAENGVKETWWIK